MRSIIRDVLLFILMYRIISLAINGAMPVDVVIIAAAASILTLWFLLEKTEIL